MSERENQTKYRPERPIYLNEENTGLRSKAEVELAVEKLRQCPGKWLCAYGQKSRPFHMSFASEKMIAEFKKDAADLGINLKSPIIKEEDFDELISNQPASGAGIEGAEETDTVDNDGKEVKNEDEPSRTYR